MKDLYASLRVEPTASSDRIAEAAEANPKVAEFSAILLDPDRRADYDRVRNVLRMIGELRRRLGLNKPDSWFAVNYPDFAGMPSAPSRGPAIASAPSIRPVPSHAGVARSAPAPRRPVWKWLLPAAVAVIGVAVIVIASRMF